jgi:hypothetical protein
MTWQALSARPYQVVQLVTALGFAHVDFTMLRDNDIDGRVALDTRPHSRRTLTTVFGMRWVVSGWGSVTKAAQV